MIEEYLVNFNFDEIDNNIYTHNPPITKEQKYYRYLFEKDYKGQDIFYHIFGCLSL